MYCAIILSLVLLIQPSIKLQAADWFNDSWSKRLSIKITNPGGAVSDCQVRLSTYNTPGFSSCWADIKGGTGRGDLSDTRFVKADNSTVLDYWIEDNTSNTSGFWIKFNGTLPAGTTIVYLYYGNPSSSVGISNGPMVFDFFDDFNSGNIDSKWTTKDNKWSASGGMAKHSKNLAGNESYLVSDNTYKDGITEAKILIKNEVLSNPDRIALIFRTTGTADGSDKYNPSVTNRFIIQPELTAQFQYLNRGLIINNITPAPEFDKWYKIKIYTSSKTINCYVDYSDGNGYVLKVSTESFFTEGNHIGFMGQYSESYVDYILQAKPYDDIAGSVTSGAVGKPALTPFASYSHISTDTVKFSCANCHHYHYLFNTLASSQPSPSDPSWDGTTAQFKMNSQGTWYFHVLAHDGDNNPAGYDNYGPIVYDTEPPAAVSLVSPSNGAITNSVNNTFSWGAGSDIGYYIYQITKDGFISYYSSGTTSSHSINLNLCQGAFAWRVYAVDTAGNISPPSQEWNLMIDTTPPSGKFELSVSATSQVLISIVDSTDALSGINQQPYSYENVNFISSSWLSSVNYCFGNLSPNTTYSFLVKIRDRALNETALALKTTSTLANIPLLNRIKKTTSTITIELGSNGNPGWTKYLCALSSVSQQGPYSYANTAAQSTFTFNSLAGNTIYYIRTRAVNSNMIETLYVESFTATMSGIPVLRCLTHEKNRYSTLPEAEFIAAGSGHYHYKFNKSISGLPSSGDPAWNGTELPLLMDTTGSWYMHIRGENILDEYEGNDDFGPIMYTSPPVMQVIPDSLLLSGQRSQTGKILGVGEISSIVLTFNQEIDKDTLNNASTLKTIKDNLGRDLFTVVPGTMVYDSGAGQYIFTSSGTLKKGYTYELRISTEARDVIGRPFEREISILFSILYDKNVDNIIESDDGKTRLKILQGTLNSDYFIVMDTGIISNSALAAACEKMRKDTGNTVLSLCRINLYNDTNSLITGALNKNAGITFSYNGLAQESDSGRLGIAKLDEINSLWVRLPSVLDSPGKSITAQVNGFSIFALIKTGSTNILDSIYAYPVPWRPNSADASRYGTLQGGITFTNLPAHARINIYDVSGQIINALEHDSVVPAHKWDGNDSGGRPAQGGVYTFIIETDFGKKTGKLMIIR